MSTRATRRRFQITTNRVKSGSINFLDDKANILLHFNPRPKNFSFIGGGEDVIVMNSLDEGRWGDEERCEFPAGLWDDNLPLTMIFDVDDDAGFSIYVESTGSMLHLFAHRLPFASFYTTRYDTHPDEVTEKWTVKELLGDAAGESRTDQMALADTPPLHDAILRRDAALALRLLAATETSSSPSSSAAAAQPLCGVQEGDSVNAMFNGFTPLHLALQQRTVEFASVCSALLEHGADVDAEATKSSVSQKGSGYNALCFLVDDETDQRNGINVGWQEEPEWAAVARALVTRTRDINHRGAVLGWGPLHLAVWNGNRAVLLLLLELRDDLDINACDNFKDTALHRAAKRGQLTFLPLLIARGGDVGQRGNQNHLPLDFVGRTQATRAEFFTSPSLPLRALEACHHALWFVMIQIDDVERLPQTIYRYVERYPSLAHARDALNRTAIELATPKNRLSINYLFLWYGRYRAEPRPEHQSSTCYVFKAVDEADLDESGRPRPCALKLMRNRDQFFREVRARARGLGEDYVLDIAARYPASDAEAMAMPEVVFVEQEGEAAAASEGGAADKVKGADPVSDLTLVPAGRRERGLRKAQAESLFCIVMPLADRNLFVCLKQERFAGRDISEVRHVFLQLCRCVQHLHDRGILHGDLKPLNAVRLAGGQWKLIDLDASSVLPPVSRNGAADAEPAGVSLSCLKFSSAYLPPEAVHIPVAAAAPGDEGCAKEGTVVKEGQSRGQAMAVSGVQPVVRPIPSHPSLDVWALGCILYQLLDPDVRPLFQGGQDDNLVCDESFSDNLRALATFDDALKGRKLGRIAEPLGRNLLAIMLEREAGKRASLARVLGHPFLTGRATQRLPGQPSLFDVFISYRVDSDAANAELLYGNLTKRGLRVWWDKKSLKAGESWKEGFISGLSQSRHFVCLLSRGAINHATKPWQNWASIAADSRCDNVLLEHRLAQELRLLGYLDKVFPVFVGDYVDASTPGYGRASDAPGSAMATAGAYSPFFAAPSCMPAAALCIVDAVEDELAAHMAQQGLGCPLSAEHERSPAGVLQAVAANQGIILEGTREEAWARASDEIASM